ncbi:MAG: DUF177 domain-containing protein, partial [Tissierellia bacterium]|nr:DUF177 domain-containing protein [Tissierellia bacterium]
MDISGFKVSDERVLEFTGSLKQNDSEYDTKNLDIQYPIHYKGRLIRLDEDMDLDIHISYDLHSPCSRCLKDVVTHVDYGTSFILVSSQELMVDEDEIEEEVLYLKDDTLPIEDIVMSLVITSVPFKVICNEDCQGLCSQCGQDLNEENCNCNLEV